MQQICWHLSDVLFWKPFGCFTHHTVHALATGVILMRSKEPIQHLSTIKQWKRSSSSEGGLWGMYLLLMIQFLRIRPCPCSGDISAEFRNGNRNKTKLGHWEKGFALSLGLSTGSRSDRISSKRIFYRSDFMLQQGSGICCQAMALRYCKHRLRLGFIFSAWVSLT